MLVHPNERRWCAGATCINRSVGHARCPRRAPTYPLSSVIYGKLMIEAPPDSIREPSRCGRPARPVTSSHGYRRGGGGSSMLPCDAHDTGHAAPVTGSCSVAVSAISAEVCAGTTGPQRGLDPQMGKPGGRSERQTGGVPDAVQCTVMASGGAGAPWCTLLRRSCRHAPTGDRIAACAAMSIAGGTAGDIVRAHPLRRRSRGEQLHATPPCRRSKKDVVQDTAMSAAKAQLPLVNSAEDHLR